MVVAARAFVDMVEKIDVPGIDLPAKDIAGIARAQDAAFVAVCPAFHQVRLEDGHPHGKIVRPVDQNVFLFGEKPNHGTGEQGHAAVAEEVGGLAGQDEVDLQFLVMMRRQLAQVLSRLESKALGSGPYF